MPYWTPLVGNDPELHGPPNTSKRLTTEAFTANLGKKIMLASIAHLGSNFMGMEVERRSQIFLRLGDEPLSNIALTAPNENIGIPFGIPQVKPSR
ncbi:MULTISPECIES: hypothetical protein [unclassified Pseudomonas]|uniref:hypothetical protein n=1 Tax=unclassified Pseudomonas TaxID=196821 RepID=UPI0011BF400E|nr:hypothetical protein [Pseudomonas sp. MWU12-2020]